MPPSAIISDALLRCCCIAVVSLARSADAFLFPPPRVGDNVPSSPPIGGPAPPSSTSLEAFRWPTTPPRGAVKRNGIDPDYPWRFEGRLVFRPSLVRAPEDARLRPRSSALLSLLGYSLGGTVALEYDASPVGPYREYVTMGGLVAAGRADVGDGAEGRTLGLGQWGADLCVSTRAAEEVCRRVWGVPARVAEIDFTGGGNVLVDGPDGDEGTSHARRKFTLSGWDNARILNGDEESFERYGGISIYWTPTIKALWAPLLFSGRGGGREEGLLPLHRLRLSASAMRLKRCKRKFLSRRTAPDRGGEMPLGLALVVDNVLIEIGERLAGDV